MEFPIPLSQFVQDVEERTANRPSISFIGGAHAKDDVIDPEHITGPLATIDERSDVDTRVYLCKYRGEDVVLKAYRRHFRTKDVIHEHGIGRIIRELDRPEFMHVVGVLKREHVKRLTNEECVTYGLIIRYVKGHPFRNWVKSHKPDSFDVVYNTMRHCMAVMQLAYERVNFTHYDLYASNIIVVDTDETKTYTFDLEGGQVVIKSQYIPVIIDFGFSYVSARLEEGGNEVRGCCNLEVYGVMCDSNPSYDIMKFLRANAMMDNRIRRSMMRIIERLFVYPDESGDIYEELTKKQRKYHKSYNYWPYKPEITYADVIHEFERLQC